MRKIAKNIKLNREIKRFEKKKKKSNYTRKKRFVYFINTVIFLLILAFLLIYGSTWTNIFIAWQLLILLILTNVLIMNMMLKKEITNYTKGNNLRDAKLLTYIEKKKEEERSQITHIILKNDEDYDVKTWKVGKSNSLIIGKTTRLRVDLDLTEASHSGLISKKHAILNKTGNGWFIEDLGSLNGTGVSRLKDNRKVKVSNAPVKVESGDIIYIATTKLLLK